MYSSLKPGIYESAFLKDLPPPKRYPERKYLRAFKSLPYVSMLYGLLYLCKSACLAITVCDKIKKPALAFLLVQATTTMSAAPIRAMDMPPDATIQASAISAPRKQPCPIPRPHRGNTTALQPCAGAESLKKTEDALTL